MDFNFITVLLNDLMSLFYYYNNYYFSPIRPLFVFRNNGRFRSIFNNVLLLFMTIDATAHDNLCT
jgi:hypothetical protein